MCGIAGAFGFGDHEVGDDDQLGAMLDCITHRGPDSEGRFVPTNDPVIMGARRLSIMDVEGGDQPITNEDGSVTVVYNGEIYNHAELREELTNQGHEFRTEADTEVLVHLWEEHGHSMPEYLDGMFAFSIWDSDQEALFLARDRLGIKPLYVTETDGPFFWASEVKSLLEAGIDPVLDDSAVRNYFTLRYWPWPQSPFDGVRKVPPGTSLLITENETEEHRYWDLSSNPRTGSINRHATDLREMLSASVERRLMSDVPLGAFLSGGLDSSSIVALISEMRDEPLDTFSIGFEDDAFDESDHARHVAEYFGTNHHEITVDLDSMDLFGEVVERFGEPLADPAALPTLALSKYASEDVKVVLSGEGADELLGGYWYFDQIPKHQQMFDRVPDAAFKLAGQIEPYAPVRNQTLRYISALRNTETAIEGVAQRFQIPSDRYLKSSKISEEGGIETLVRSTESYADTDDFYKRMLAFDIKYWLPDDLLYKVDQSSMAASLEARVPFLDHELVEFGFNLPVEYKQDGYKRVLKRAMKDLLPKRVLQRNKHGLGVPVGDWFRSDHKAITSWMTEQHLEATPYVEPDSVFRIWDAHRSGADYGLTLWKILTFVAWYHTIVLPYRK
ncbi:asparagine synthase (glutamine-hydrolyzing) [Salinibaculum rarum]|uniref:asparagine synthase (glutamine-hydrolyzing) n=1 Tax=Salinibaculum rarum TaxID=3058903 RepID=UPI00265EABC9|nr:asparagine synthase (glutamine-hydrolyzing) [Salinibaculum sp. KK48]